jgi:hypothetical protein
MAARRSRQTRFTALLHHVDEVALLRSFQRQRRAASAGVDGMTVEGYERDPSMKRLVLSTDGVPEAERFSIGARGQ